MNVGVRAPLRELTSVITKGTTPKTLGLAHTSSGIPFLRAENIRDLTVVPTDRPLYIDERVDAALSRSRIRPNDVLISIAGTIGRVGVVPENAPAMNCNQAIAIVRVNEQVLPRYLGRWLMSADAQMQMARAQVTATISNLSLGQIGELVVPVPPQAEQRRIADILDKVDAIRRKRKEAIALTEELLRSAFLEMFGDPVTNPKGWPVKPLGAIAEAASGVTKGKRYDGLSMVTLPYMRVANVQDGHLALKEIKTITVSKDDGRRYQLQEGDVLLTEGGDPDKLGRGTVWRGEVANCIHQNHIFRVRPGSAVRSEYLSAIIGSERGKRYFLQAAKQTTGIATINMTQLKAFPVLLPPIELQARYSAFIERGGVTRGALKQRGELVDDLFNSLVSRAFSGGLSA